MRQTWFYHEELESLILTMKIQQYEKKSCDVKFVTDIGMNFRNNGIQDINGHIIMCLNVVLLIFVLSVQNLYPKMILNIVL
uniref:Uncharacterized protein n=1 Tax=Acrobeloides nanus TaxID=290746 RepID=A0A914D7W5_9BILA